MHKKSTFSTKLTNSRGGSYGSVALLSITNASLLSNKTQEAALISLGFQMLIQAKSARKQCFLVSEVWYLVLRKGDGETAAQFIKP